MAINYKAYRDGNGEVIYVRDGSYADANIGPLTRVSAMDYSVSNDELTNESVVPEHTHEASEITDFGTAVDSNASVVANTAKRSYPLADETKLSNIENNAKDDQNSDEVPFDNTGTNLSGLNAAAVIKELDTRTSSPGGLVHSNLGGLGNDDHTQYHNDARGDIRYYTKALLDSGQLDNRYYTETELDNGALDTLYYTQSALDGGVLDSRYFTETELLTGGVLDSRYFTETELLTGGALDTVYYNQTILNNGVLDTRYYTETELNNGQLNNLYYTQALLDSGQLDNRYYTETELNNGALDTLYYTKALLDAGQLDNRYYTETELNSGILDTRYYTETELNSGVLNGLYYTQTAADLLLAAKQSISEKNQPNGYAGVGANGKIPSSLIPAIAITEPFVVADIAARDALVIGPNEGEVQKGDMAIVIDASADADITVGGATYIYDGSAWTRMITPTDLIISVNGQTGAVILTTSDVAEGTNLYYTETRVSNNASVVANTAHRNLTSGNPHQVTLTETIAEDSGTDITVAELETLTDNSDASGLHNHDTQYYTKTLLDSGQLDNRYFTEAELATGGALDSRYYTKTLLDGGQLNNLYYTETELDAGQLDNRYYTETELDNGALDTLYYTQSALDGGVLDSRYFTETELLTGGALDTLYYTKTLLDSGQLDNRYFTETELTNGVLDSRYYTEAELNAGQLNSLYYTKTELDAGQLDNRYYTEAEADILLSQKVTGPGSAVADKIATFDGTTGKLIKDSGIGIVDEDDMASDSATDIPTQQSVKAYVDGGLKWTVTQAAHGFTISNNIPIPARLSGATYVAAQANSNSTLSAFYITRIIDANTFEVRQQGIHNAPSHGLTTGQYYFLDADTAGTVTSTEPLNSINDVVWYIIDANNMLLIDNRPVDNESLQKYLIKTSNTDTTTNLNQTSFTAVPLTGSTEVNENNYYTVSGSGIRIDNTRSYTVTANVHYTSTGQRVALQGRFYINGNPVGAITSTGYIRAANGHNEATLHLTEKFSLTELDIIEFRVQRESTLATNTTMPIIGSSNLMIEGR